MGSGGKPQVNKAEDARTNAAIEPVKTAGSWFDEYQKQAFEKWREWEQGPGPKDITSAPGMDFSTDIYRRARERANQARVGDPTKAFTANLPGYNNQLQQQKAMELHDTTAQALSNAFQQNKAQALGMGAGAADTEMQRANAYAQLRNAYSTSYYNRPQSVPLWQQIAGVAIGGLGAAGGMMSGMGAMGFKPFGK